MNFSIKIITDLIVIALPILAFTREDFFRDKRTRKYKTISKILLWFWVVAVCSQVHKIYDDYRETLKRANTGKITNNSKFIFSPKIQFGSSGPILEGNFSIFKKRGFDVKTISGKLFVSITFADSQGNIVAEIKDNNWKINPHFSFDRNYSSDAFEVKDNAGRVVLQLQIKNDIVQFQGILFDPEKKWYELMAEREREGRMDGVIEFKNKIDEFTFTIQPIFKYPSEEYLGERLSKVNPEKSSNGIDKNNNVYTLK